MSARVVITLVAALAFAVPAQAAPGDLDPLFSGDGTLTTTFSPGSTDFPTGVAVQGDGKIVAAGRTNPGTGDDSALARYNADGTLDTSFSGDGLVTTAVGPAGDAFSAVAIQPDGRLVASGYVSLGQNSQQITVARFDPDGTPDTSFSGDGIQTTLVGTVRASASDVAVQPDGKIVVAGTSFQNGADDFTAVRYLPDGTPDTGFSGDGIQTTEVNASSDEASAVAIQPDGKIVLGGYVYQGLGTTHDFALTRYNADGTPDTGFSGDGIQTTVIRQGSDGVSAVLVRPDGRIVAVGDSPRAPGVGDFTVAQYGPDGTLDTGFSGDGIQTTPTGVAGDGASDAVLQPDGKIVAVGNNDEGSSETIALVRWDADGTPDATFSGDGVQTTPIGELSNGTAVALQADGKIVVAGIAVLDLTASDIDFALARYQGAGDPVAAPPEQPPVRPGAPATCRGLRATLVAKPGQLTTGTSGRDVILGTAGAERIRGVAGNDVICGGGGDDRIDAGGGNDGVYGGDGGDRVWGGDGNDRISGADGKDRLSGGEGGDHIQGDDDGDRVSGGDGNDRASGGDGNDRVSGGKGNDRLWGRSGADRIDARDGRRDRVNCGDGKDAASLEVRDRGANCE